MWFRRRQTTAAATTLRSFCRASVIVQNRYFGNHKHRTTSLRCVPPSSSTVNHQHILASAYFKRSTIPAVPMLSNKRNSRSSKVELIWARASQAARRTGSARYVAALTSTLDAHSAGEHGETWEDISHYKT